MILIEENFEGVETVTEAVQEGKKTYLTGVFGEAETKNRNGRVYDLEEMKKVVHQINDAAKLNRHILAELDHPSTLEIKLENVSHRLMEAKMQGNQMWCKAEILDKHPKGAILKSLIDSGVQVGVSTRGSGQVNENTGKVKNFNFITCDAVATPSCRTAYPETLEEQLSMYSKGDVITDLSEAVVNDPIAQRYFQMEMQKFIETLYNK